MDKKVYQIILNKEKHQYIFRYSEGQEDILIKSLADLAKKGTTNDEKTDFNWIDAATISYQIGRISKREF